MIIFSNIKKKLKILFKISNNKFYFRYDNEGCPVDVKLLDLQIYRVASPVLDLHQILYVSTWGKMRQENLDVLLTTYLNSFNKVLASGNKSPMFTQDQLFEEFKKKSKFGLLVGLWQIPAMFLDPEDVPDLNLDLEDLIKQWIEIQERIIDKHPILKDRLKDMADDMVTYGTIK